MSRICHQQQWISLRTFYLYTILGSTQRKDFKTLRRVSAEPLSISGHLLLSFPKNKRYELVQLMKRYLLFPSPCPEYTSYPPQKCSLDFYNSIQTSYSSWHFNDTTIRLIYTNFFKVLFMLDNCSNIYWSIYNYSRGSLKANVPSQREGWAMKC